jgi:hypothetical protein
MPTEEERDALAGVLAPFLWVSDLRPGIGDCGYYTEDPRTVAQAVLDQYDVTLKATSHVG